MSRVYSVAAKSTTIEAAAATLVAINPGLTRALEFLRAWVGQDANATSAQEGIEIGTKATAFSTLTSSTPAKLTTSDPVSAITGATTGAAGTSGVDATTEGAGATTVIWPDNFNVLNGWLWVPTPKEVVVFPASSSLACTLKFQAQPGTLTDWSFGMIFGELG
jgi:hypothetical protein